jgi:hypothetical protein
MLFQRDATCTVVDLPSSALGFHASFGRASPVDNNQLTFLIIHMGSNLAPVPYLHMCSWRSWSSRVARVRLAEGRARLYPWQPAVRTRDSLYTVSTRKEEGRRWMMKLV